MIISSFKKIIYRPESGYRSRFSHETEKAEPGYYRFMLDDYKINAEMTTTTHVGFHQYSFPKTEEAHVILDLNHGIYNYDGKVLWSYLRVENDTLVTTLLFIILLSILSSTWMWTDNTVDSTTTSIKPMDL